VGGMITCNERALNSFGEKSATNEKNNHRHTVLTHPMVSMETAFPGGTPMPWCLPDQHDAGMDVSHSFEQYPTAAPEFGHSTP